MADAPSTIVVEPVSTWLLAGGEGRRMGGHDKGLVCHQGRPLAQWVLEAVGPQCSQLAVSANRNQQAYADLLVAQAEQHGFAKLGVHPDAPDLPLHSGPLAGIVTALRACPDNWLMVVPCDTPHLPGDLIARLHAAAAAEHAEVAVPVTHPPLDGTRYHWVCALVHRQVLSRTEALFAAGERRVGAWVRSLRWCSVTFDDPKAFDNMNTLETPHGGT